MRSKQKREARETRMSRESDKPFPAHPRPPRSPTRRRISLSRYWLQLFPEAPAQGRQTGLAYLPRGDQDVFQPVRTARGQSTYKCPNCNRFYMRTSCLKRHLRVECGQAPKYQCKICQGWFKYKHNLVAHMKHHIEEPKHHCDLCSKKFYRRDKLVEHQKKLHKAVREALPVCGDILAETIMGD
ncbi:hypothetical protein KM043_007695 [Ampulex compressa]|nr:hypothetical protein KM043_007695 [Ampulex compressa]